MNERWRWDSNCAVCQHWKACEHRPDVNFGDPHDRGEMVCDDCYASLLVTRRFHESLREAR